MLDDRPPGTEASAEVESLRAQLAEARETIRAIRTGEVDAIVAETATGDQVFTLRSADHPYRIFIEQMNQGAATLSADGDLLYGNQALADLLGEPLGQLMGAQVVKFVAEADRAALLEMIQRVVGGPPSPSVDRAGQRREGSRGEFELVSAAGERIPAYVWIFGFPEGQAPLVCVLVTDLRDTRAREALRRHAAQLDAQSVELARSNRDLEDFAHVAAHDLKEPLRGIRTVSSFLVEDYGARVGPDGLEKLATLDRLAKRMHDLLDALLSYATAGRSDLAPVRTDLNQVVAEAVATLRLPPLAAGASVQIVAPLPTVVCDRLLIGQVFTNLISNGLKYNTATVKRVEVGARDGEQGPVIYVRDNGIGVPDQHRETIFGIFKRLHMRDMYGGGAGAGLAIVKKIVERHGGRVWNEPTPGGGTTFCFTLGEPGRSAGAPAEGSGPGR